MKKKREQPVAAAELRRQAEMRLSERTKKAAPPPATEADSRRLVHELEVHQIELEMQNEELRRVQEELEESRAKYFDLYNLAPVGYLTLSLQGLILEANLTAAKLLGIEKSQLVKKAVTRFIAREDQDIYYLHRQKLFETRAPQVCELRMMGKGGVPFWGRLDAILLVDAASGAPLYRVGMSNITARKQMEEELRRAKASVEEANLELQRMFAREQHFARTDALTGVNNRRYWFELAEHEFEVAARYRHPLSVIMFDIDHFKLVNDRFGHAVGDQMLERVAQVAHAALRSADVIGRYGGEEAVIALPVTTAPQAYPVAERIRAGVAAIRIRTPKGDAAVTLSIGITERLLGPPAERPGGDDSVERAIHRADEAMYAAKQAGGNRIATWSAPAERPGASQRKRGGAKMPAAKSGRRLGRKLADRDKISSEEAVLRQSTEDRPEGRAVVVDISERKQTEEALRQRLAELEALRTVSAALRAAQTRDEALPILLDETLAALDTDAGIIWLHYPDSDELRAAVARGWLRQVSETPMKPGEGVAGTVFASGRTHLSAEFARDPLVRQPAAGPVPAGWGGVCLPIHTGGITAGVLFVSVPLPRQIAPEQVRLLESLTEMAGGALHRMSLHEATVRRLDQLHRSNVELALAYDATTEGLSRALDLRDKETEGHTQRVTEMTIRLAKALGIGAAELVHIHRGALLHDIGKLGVPDVILHKPGPLTEDEWKLMRQHPQFSFDLLAPITYLKPALVIPYCHHEKWDGTGYPRGLKGEQILPAARLFAIVDVWDALMSDRPYREAWPEEKVLEHIRSLSGTHFDPKVVELFLKVMNEDAEGAG